jgi:hypothetical protein
MDDSSGRGNSENQDQYSGPTIVGGRPLGGGGLHRDIPRGIEVLVKKASVDPAFREVLLEKRAETAAEIGLDLSAAEAAMLNAVPRAQIEQIIENTTVPDEHRRAFLGRVAAAMLALVAVSLTGSSAEGSDLSGRSPLDERRVGGIRPDYPKSDRNKSTGEADKPPRKRDDSAGTEGKDGRSTDNPPATGGSK